MSGLQSCGNTSSSLGLACGKHPRFSPFNFGSHKSWPLGSAKSRIHPQDILEVTPLASSSCLEHELASIAWLPGQGLVDHAPHSQTPVLNGYLPYCVSGSQPVYRPKCTLWSLHYDLQFQIGHLLQAPIYFVGRIL
jgi:hypothetical protein